MLPTYNFHFFKLNFHLRIHNFYVWKNSPYHQTKRPILGHCANIRLILTDMTTKSSIKICLQCTYLVFWEQLVLCTVLRRRKNHFKNQNSCFFFQNQEALVCKPLFPHVSNAFSQQLLSYWQKCYSLNLSETRTLIRWEGIILLKSFPAVSDSPR